MRIKEYATLTVNFVLVHDRQIVIAVMAVGLVMLALQSVHGRESIGMHVPTAIAAPLYPANGQDMDSTPAPSVPLPDNYEEATIQALASVERVERLFEETTVEGDIATQRE